MEILFDIFLPQSCVYCGSLGAVLCKECCHNLVRLKKDFYYSNSVGNYVDDPTQNDLKISCFYSYKGVFEACIKAAKFNPKHFGVIGALVSCIELQKDYFSNCILVPVPISRARFKERGFNQALIIAKKLASKFGTPVMDVITRERDTTAQFKNKRSERFKNLSGAFKLKKFPKLPNKKIVIVDDICTSGATLSEIYKTLLNEGCRDVEGFCLSKKL